MIDYTMFENQIGQVVIIKTKFDNLAIKLLMQKWMCKKMKHHAIPKSLSNSCKKLVALVKTMYKNMPVLMVTFTALIVFLATQLAINITGMLFILSFLILFSSIFVYVNTKNYGEAVLTLSAGLFTVYTVKWTLDLFLGFIIVWVLFTISVFLIIALRQATNIENILLEATILLHNSEFTNTEIKQQLEEISNSSKDCILMPEERATIIRLFCFRKIEIDRISIALKWVNSYYTITKIPYLDIASFVTEVIKNTSVLNAGATIDDIFDYIYVGMRNTPASPLEYMEAFKRTRYILASTKNTLLYFNAINKFFYTGQRTSNIEDYVEQNVIAY